MKIEGLPGIPRFWLDFLESKLPALPLPSSIAAMAADAGQIRTRAAVNEELIGYLSGQEKTPRIAEKVRQLEQRDSVVVVAVIAAALFGGPVAQILKCLTAIRACEELARFSANAVPVCWIGTAAAGFDQWSATLIDAESELHSLNVSHGGVVPGSIADVISRVSDFGRGSFDPETLESLGAAFVPGSSFSSATARLFSSLMEDLGIITVDAGAPEVQRVLSGMIPPAGIAGPPHHLLISSVMPVLAFVVEPPEVQSLVQSMTALDEAGLPRPSAWPQASATLGDMKSRRAFGRYYLDLTHLFPGEEEVLRGMKNAMPRSGLAKLEGIKPYVDRRVAGLKSYWGGEKRFSERADSCKRKILYQLDKLRNHFEAALELKEQTAGRRIHRLCNLLAPNGRLQEWELAGIQVPLSYSRTGLRSLYDKLDIRSFEHQLIWMD